PLPRRSQLLPADAHCSNRAPHNERPQVANNSLHFRQFRHERSWMSLNELELYHDRSMALASTNSVLHSGITASDETHEAHFPSSWLAVHTPRPPERWRLGFVETQCSCWNLATEKRNDSGGSRRGFGLTRRRVRTRSRPGNAIPVHLGAAGEHLQAQ